MTEPAATVARDAHERLTASSDRFVDLLSRLVRAESPSTVPESQADVRALLEAELTDLGFEIEYTPGVETGGYIRASLPGAEGPGQLILGHMDTVWDLGTLETMPCVVEDGVLRGPGSFDMKCGIAMALSALRVLREAGVTLDVSPVFMITSDEEIGSPESEAAIIAEAKRSDRVFVVEPALGTEGLIKTRRKGVGQFSIDVYGVAAHGGLAPEEGASAVVEMAHVIQELGALHDLETGATVNVGVVTGGTRANVVPDHAHAEVDARAWSVAEARELDAAIRAIEPVVARTRIEVSGGFDREPLEKTPDNAVLWEATRAIGEAIGVSLEEGSAGGASDGNFTSQYAPTLDGIGAVGDGAHADHEHIDIARSLERAAILAGLFTLPPTRGSG